MKKLGAPSPTFLLAALLFGLPACGKRAAHEELSIAAATSLREVMPELVRVYEGTHPTSHVAATYGASGDLRRQVEGGAPLDAVFFAGPKPLDELVREGRVEASSRHVVASNSLVLVGPKGAPALTFGSLAALPEGARVAVGDPRTVPAGEYARDFLTALGEWDALQPRLVLGSNVAAVLVYARRGEANAAVVYRTELRGVTDLVELDEARGPHAPHPTVVAGAVRGGHAEAGDFLDFVASPAGVSIFASFGFGPP
jgi:molybdate transport system substrate-binding protein